MLQQSLNYKTFVLLSQRAQPIKSPKQQILGILTNSFQKNLTIIIFSS